MYVGRDVRVQAGEYRTMWGCGWRGVELRGRHQRQAGACTMHWNEHTLLSERNKHAGLYRCFIWLPCHALFSFSYFPMTAALLPRVFLL
jgi:hypothetical protein